MSFISKIYDTLTSVAQAINICKKSIHYQLDTEIDTGDYWIDGKKIYFQLIKIDLNSNGIAANNVISSKGFDYIEKLVKFCGVISVSKQYPTTNVIDNFGINKQDDGIYIYNYRNVKLFADCILYIPLYYTKIS